MWSVPQENDCILNKISPFFFIFGRAAVEEVSAILSGKAQHLLHGSISNSLTGTYKNTLRIQNEDAEHNNLPYKLSETKTEKKGKMAIMWG